MSYSNQQRLRKAAILVASLDEPSAQRLLAKLPPAEAAALQRAVDELGGIDPEETDDVLQEFRLSNSAAAQLSEGVVAQWSDAEADSPWDAPEVYASFGRRPNLDDTEEQAASFPADPTPVGGASPDTHDTQARAFAFLREADKRMVAKWLLRENPQTVAVVISQLAAEVAADLLVELPGSLQADVLERLADTQPADHQTLQVVESHLSAWLEEHRLREERQSQGSELVRQIVANTPDKQREELIRQLGRRNESLAQSCRTQPNPQPPIDNVPDEKPNEPAFVAQQATDLASALMQSREADPASEWAEAPPAVEPPATVTIDFAHGEANPMESLNAVSDHVLLETLRQADPQIAMLALGGADAKLLSRILGQLNRRQARQFRRQLRCFEPTRLSDLLRAQHEFVQLARQIAEQPPQRLPQSA